MKRFIFVIIAATIIGGFVGGELTDRTFTLTGAVIGGLGLASVLLGLGAYFDAQEKKKRKEDLPPEIRAVFDRMFEKTLNSPLNRPGSPKTSSTNKSVTGQEANPLLRNSEKNETFFLSTVAQLLSVQLLPKYQNPKKAFGELMTNKRAAGYVFGFHDALLQKLGLYEPAHKEHAATLIGNSYKRIFGEQAGFALYSMSVVSQDDPVFFEGRMNGGNELAEYIDKKVQPLGLGRILILGMKA